MRGNDDKQQPIFSYVSLEERVPADHPLRPIRRIVDGILTGMSKRFDMLYAESGRPSIPPERLLRALLLQIFYSVRSERMLMEQLDYNLLFRWFVGLEIDEPVWNHAVFSKNRERLLNEETAREFFARVLEKAQGQLSKEHLHRGRHAGRSVGFAEELPAQGGGQRRRRELPRREAPQ